MLRFTGGCEARACGACEARACGGCEVLDGSGAGGRLGVAGCFVADVSGFVAKDQEKRIFKPYAVRVTTQCSYEQLARLVETLESTNPYLTINGLAIANQPDAPARHQVTLSIEWPNWKDADKSHTYRSEESHDPA